MAYYNQQMVRAVDPDLVAIMSSAPTAAPLELILLSHEALALNVNPVITADGASVTFGALNSASDYEIVRISSTQSIVVKTVVGSPVIHMVTPGPGVVNGAEPIGQASIGSTFIIG
jgi:hypothetical protein